MGGVSVFGQLRVSSAGKLLREEDRWRQKSVSGEIIVDTCPSKNNKSNKEMKGKQVQFKFTLWSRISPSQSKKE